MLFRAVTVFSIFSLAFAQYPATFPFVTDHGQDYIPTIPQSTPSLSFDDADPGGYLYHYLYIRIWTDDDMPFCATQSGAMQYILVNYGVAGGWLPIDTWNCSAKNLKFTTADFTGIINGEVICAPGECCQTMIGDWKYSDDQMNWHTTMTNTISTASCGGLPEAVYCGLVDGHYRTNCMDRNLSPGTRSVIMACPDAHYFYWTSCPVLLTTGLYLGLDAEPPLYDSRLTVEGVIMIEVLVNNCDYVCHQHTYYFPSSSTSGSTTTTSTTTSSASTYFSYFMLLLTVSVCAF